MQAGIDNLIRSGFSVEASGLALPGVVVGGGLALAGLVWGLRRAAAPRPKDPGARRGLRLPLALVALGALLGGPALWVWATRGGVELTVLEPRDPGTWPLTQVVYVAAVVVVAALLMTFAAVFAGITTWVERRVAGRMQSRVGANRVGPAGFLQWVADALKLLLKEDLIPRESDRRLFRFAPYLVVMGLIGAFVVLPFGPNLVAADMNVGVFFVLAVTALEVVGILMSGWASNSKWSLLGGFRAAAQVVSYEIPAGLALMVPVLMTGSLSLQTVIRAQGGAPADTAWYLVGGWPWNWYAFANPMAFVAMFIFFISALAEGSRTPFDLPEAESELVAGFATEYSGMRFAFYYLSEFANIWVFSAITVTLFLGGWQIPGVSTATLFAATGGAAVVYELLGVALFVGKTLFLAFVVLWLRWTLPRIRVDQMMQLCWKYLVPAGMVLVVLTGLSEWLVTAYVSQAWITVSHFAFFALLGLLPAYRFVRRTVQQLRLAGVKPDVIHNW